MSQYAKAGVNIEVGDSFVQAIMNSCRSTYNDNVFEGVGCFCSLYRLGGNQLLAASTDGVGTKTLLAGKLSEYGFLQIIGIDLVAMVVNDIITCGAKPLFLLDCYGLSNLEKHLGKSIEIIRGISAGCKLSDCCLIGGETAEMPDVYENGHFEIFGFGVGLVDESRLLGKHLVKENDIVIGIPSSGPHSNGYSLIRHAFKRYNWETDHQGIRDLVMSPTRIYTSMMTQLLEDENHGIHASAHITGGGLYANTLRSVPSNLKLEIDWSKWKRPEIFEIIQRHARLEEDEMRQVFNCGIGFTLIVDPDLAQTVIDRTRGIMIGRIYK